MLEIAPQTMKDRYVLKLTGKMLTEGQRCAAVTAAKGGQTKYIRQKVTKRTRFFRILIVLGEIILNLLMKSCFKGEKGLNCQVVKTV